MNKGFFKDLRIHYISFYVILDVNIVLADSEYFFNDKFMFVCLDLET